MCSVTGKLLLLLFVSVVAVLAPGRAQTDKEVLIGSCAALQGPASFLGRETVIGAETYFQLTNEEVGVHGRKLRLISADDSYDPAKTQAC